MFAYLESLKFGVYQQDWRCDHCKRAQRTRVRESNWLVKSNEHSTWQCSAAKSVNTSIIFQAFHLVSPYEMVKYGKSNLQKQL